MLEQDPKNLWKRYGNKVAAMILFILIIVIGFQYSHYRANHNNVQAAEMYQKMMLIAQAPQPNDSAIQQQANQIISLYPSSIYATFSAWEAAKIAVQNNQPDQANQILSIAVKNSDDANAKAITQLRLARVQLSQNQTQSAIDTLTQINNNGFAVMRDMLLGDAYIQQQNPTQAKAAWVQALALAQQQDMSDAQSILQMKLANLNTQS